MAEEIPFSFNPLPNKNFSFLQDKHILARLMKWSMLGRISVQSYSFDRCYFNGYNIETFAECFFRDPAVVCTLRKMVGGLSVPLDKPVLSVSVEPVPCTKITMDLFDPIYSCGILRPSGHVVKCFHDVYPDYDELRKMLQDDSSEYYYVVRREERKEFLFCLFKHLYLGGELCQYDDTIDPYISTTKKIYKDLISVEKWSKMIRIVSRVFKVCAFDESGRCFPGTREEEQTFAYLIVDPYKNQVTLFCHFYGVGNFTL